MLEIIDLIFVLIAISLGAYFQTITGFGLGIIVIGICTLFKLAPISIMATVVSIITLPNCLSALIGKKIEFDKSLFIAIILGIFPGTLFGIYLLNTLSDSATNLLSGALGCMILFSSLTFIFHPKINQRPSKWASFVGAGFASGFSGGLFGMAGPPVVYHLYKQPMAIETIRTLLLLIFTCTSSSRTLIVYLQGDLTQNISILALIAVPLVYIVTMLARKYPPPFKSTTLRKIVFITLVSIAIQLIIKFFLYYA